MDEILKNIFPYAIEEAAKQRQEEEEEEEVEEEEEEQQQQQHNNNNNNIDEVWKDIVASGGANHLHNQQHYHHPSSDEGFSACGAGGGDEVTLEEFLVKSGAVPFPHHQYPSSSSVDDGSNSLQLALGKRKAVDETLDKAALQKQKRMIKNRESAARSRERKQAYTTELESLVKHLEIENKRLLEEQAERKKQRLKELQELLIPITEQPRPKRKLKRWNSS